MKTYLATKMDGEIVFTVEAETRLKAIHLAEDKYGSEAGRAFLFMPANGRRVEAASMPGTCLPTGSAVLWRREWAMANGETFTVKPIGAMVKRYLEKSKVSVDPFARNKLWATHTNDLNPATEAEHHMDSIAFLEMLVAKGTMADLVIFDPPYSPRQIKECYNSIGLKMGALDAMRTNWMRERNLIAQMQQPGDVVLSFGWNSMGMGKRRGYEVIEGLMVCHGVGHYDTLCMAERMAWKQDSLFPPNDKVSDGSANHQ